MYLLFADRMAIQLVGKRLVRAVKRQFNDITDRCDTHLHWMVTEGIQ